MMTMHAMMTSEEGRCMKNMDNEAMDVMMK
jgi:hypothetical protein